MTTMNDNDDNDDDGDDDDDDDDDNDNDDDDDDNNDDDDNDNDDDYCGPGSCYNHHDLCWQLNMLTTTMTCEGKGQRRGFRF